MNIPGFTAESSLRGANGHYRSAAGSTRLPSRGAGAVLPALKRETIEVSSCSPGFLQLGEGPNMTCIPDPSWDRGHGSGDPPPGGLTRGPAGRGRDELPVGWDRPHACDPSERSVWYQCMTESLDLARTDMDALRACWLRNGCPDLSDPVNTCFQSCPWEDFQTLPLNDTIKRNAQESCDDQLKNTTGCFFPSPLKKHFLDQW